MKARRQFQVSIKELVSDKSKKLHSDFKHTKTRSLQLHGPNYEDVALKHHFYPPAVKSRRTSTLEPTNTFVYYLLVYAQVVHTLGKEIHKQPEVLA